MSDLFHPKVPFSFIHKVFAITQKAYQHKYLILTKRVKRLLEFTQTCIQHDKYGQAIQPSAGKYYHNYFSWPHDNIWLGVSICTPDELWKADELRKIPAAVRYISLEPLLEDMGEINLNGISWIIVGGESGPKARPMHPDWVRIIRDQCIAADVPFFLKGWGEWLSGADKYALKINTYQGYYPKRVAQIGNTTFFRVGKNNAGCLLDGREWKQYPEQAKDGK
jgi:protein gp37